MAGSHISPETKQQIREFLAVGELTHKKMARMFNVSTHTIWRIKYVRGRKTHKAKLANLSELKFQGVAQRCPDCGVKAYFPVNQTTCYECTIKRGKKYGSIKKS